MRNCNKSVRQNHAHTHAVIGFLIMHMIGEKTRSVCSILNSYAHQYSLESIFLRVYCMYPTIIRRKADAMNRIIILKYDNKRANKTRPSWKWRGAPCTCALFRCQTTSACYPSLAARQIWRPETSVMWRCSAFNTLEKGRASLSAAQKQQKTAELPLK